MTWISEGTDFLTVFAAIIAIVAAIFTFFVSLEQISGISRARRIVEWTTTALNVEENEGRREFLNQLKLKRLSYLIALYQVPWWRFTEVIISMFLAPLTVMLTASVSGNGMTDIIVSALSGLAAATWAIRRCIRIYAERVRVAHEFFIGKTPITPAKVDLLAQMEGGSFREFVLAFGCSVVLMATSAFVALALIVNILFWLTAFMGVVSCWFVALMVRHYAQSWAKEVSSDS